MAVIGTVTNYLTNPSFRAAAGGVEVRRNLANNPRATTVTGYAMGGAGASVVAAPWDATMSAVTSTSNGAGTFYMFGSFAGEIVLNAAVVTVSAMIQVPAGKYYRVYTHVRTGNVYYAASAFTLSNGSPVRVASTATLTADAPDLDIAVLVYDDAVGTVLATGAQCYIGNVMLSKTAQLYSYFDGTTAAAAGLTYSWLGTVDASESKAVGVPISGWGGANAFYSTGVSDGYGGMFGEIGGALNATSYSGNPPTATVGQYWAARAILAPDPDFPYLANETVRLVIHDGTGYVTSNTATAADVFFPYPTAAREYIAYSRSAITNTLPRVYVYRSSGAPIRIARVIMQPVSGPGLAPLPYFDGNSTDGYTVYSWSGTVDASASNGQVWDGSSPDVKVEIAFDSPALSASPVWTDVTDYAQRIESSRGRNMELSQFDAGSVAVTLDNSDGRFTPRITALPGQPTLRPRRALRVTAAFQSGTYAIAYGFIEQWPATLDGGLAFTVTVPATDAFRILSGTTFPDSDNGALNKFKPINYWPCQETAGPITYDSVGGRNLQPFWSSLNDRSTDDNAGPLPVITYGATSNLPSGSGVSIDLNAVWVGTGTRTGANALFADPPINFNGNRPWSVTFQCIIGTLSKADGVAPVLVGTVDKAATFNRTVIQVKSDGSVWVLGVQVAPAGTFAANTLYRVTMSYSCDIGTPNVSHVGLTINGTTYRYDGSGITISPDGDWMTFGGLGALGSGGTGGRWSNIALWDRALSDSEAAMLYGDNVCAPGMLADTRINRLLDYMSWPTALRSLNMGKSPLIRDSWTADTSALSLVQKWAEADGGSLYVGPDGAITFRNRHARYANSGTPVYTFDTSADTGVESGLTFVMSEDDVKNVVNLEVSYGTKATIRNESSIADYGEKPIGIKLDVQNDYEGIDAANITLARYAQPIVRVSAVTLLPTSASSGVLWVPAMSLDIGNIVRLGNLPATAPAAQLDYFVESIKHSIVRDGSTLVWATTFDVSPLPVASWVLDNAVNSVLDSTTRLAY